MEEKDLAQLVREFIEALGLFLRQQGRELATEVLMKPLRRAGSYVLLLVAVACLLVLGLVFVGLGAASALIEATGSKPAGYLLCGLVVLLAAYVAYYLGTKQRARKVVMPDEQDAS